MVFDVWAWRWSWLRPWFVTKPDLGGTYLAKAYTKEGLAFIGYMVVRQRHSRISMRLLTAGSRSELVSSEMIRADDGTYSVAAIYDCAPNPGQGTKHLGAMMLDVELDGKSPRLHGKFWTELGDVAELQLTKHVGHAFHSFDVADDYFCHEYRNVA